MNTPVAITAYYKFFPIAEENIASLRQSIIDKGAELDMRGLTLIATEGLNGTVSGTPEAIEQYKEFIEDIAGETVFKDSFAETQPMKRWLVKIRKEIVGLDKPDIVPTAEQDHHHLTPAEWKQVLESEDVVLLDTRNTYETEVGTFKNAIDPQLESFDQFPEYVEKCDIPKDKKVLMFCTGGIRCEKALLEMEQQGYKNVYQLKGGILQYLQEYPDTHYEGECFVFDHRAAVDQKLEPSKKYKLCPHCGDCGNIAVDCPMCPESGVICKRCAVREDLHTCCKNCAERFRRGLKPLKSSAKV